YILLAMAETTAYLELFFLRGTLAPLRRASDKPIAIACFRLFTVFPLLPDFSLPCFILCILRLTDLLAFSLSLAIGVSFQKVLEQNANILEASATLIPYGSRSMVLDRQLSREGERIGAARTGAIPLLPRLVLHRRDGQSLLE